MEQAGATGRRRAVVGACLLLAAVAAVTAVVLWPDAPVRDAGPPVSQVLSSSPPSPATSPAAPSTSAVAPTGPGRTTATVPVVRSDPPASLTVPSLGVDADVVAVGTSDDGAMEIPRDGATIGWYRWGPEAGAAQGNTVLSGHVSTRAGGPGALAPLAEVQVGDALEVRTASGALLPYRVVSLETITKSVLPVDRIFARDGPHRLVVVTCGGPFQPELGSFRDNVVVVAEPVDPGADGTSTGQAP